MASRGETLPISTRLAIPNKPRVIGAPAGSNRTGTNSKAAMLMSTSRCPISTASLADERQQSIASSKAIPRKTCREQERKESRAGPPRSCHIEQQSLASKESTATSEEASNNGAAAALAECARKQAASGKLRIRKGVLLH